MSKFCFILNPHSGRNRRRPWLLARLRDWIAAQGLEATVFATEGPHHATDLARAAVARNCDRVVAVGGDGTMNEVACALVDTPAALGLLPGGSGNGLGRHLGIPSRLADALRIVVTGRVAAIDTGTANEHPFFNVMGLGFDAEISRRFNVLRHRGLLNYVRAGCQAFVRYRPDTYTLASDGWERNLDCFIAAVANSDEYGNGARIAPGARVDDGRLDLVAVSPIGFLGAAGLVYRLFTGSFLRSPHVVHRRAAHFTIRRRAPGLIHVDGETRPIAAVVDVRVRPQCLRVVVPV